MTDIEGFILAGGASSRMGEDKSRLRLDGRTFVEIIAGALRLAARGVSLVSSRPEASAHGLAVVPDLHEKLGPLGGIHAALAHCAAPWALIVSCDLPFVTHELFARLAAFRDAETESVAPLQEDGRLSPLCALYAARPCRPVADALIRAGELRPRELLKRVRTRRVAFDELSDLDGASLFFKNVNTPEDYKHALSEGKSRKTNGKS